MVRAAGGGAPHAAGDAPIASPVLAHVSGDGAAASDHRTSPFVDGDTEAAHVDTSPPLPVAPRIPERARPSHSAVRAADGDRAAPPAVGQPARVVAPPAHQDSFTPAGLPVAPASPRDGHAAVSDAAGPPVIARPNRSADVNRIREMALRMTDHTNQAPSAKPWATLSVPAPEARVAPKGDAPAHPHFFHAPVTPFESPPADVPFAVAAPPAIAPRRAPAAPDVADSDSPAPPAGVTALPARARRVPSEGNTAVSPHRFFDTGRADDKFSAAAPPRNTRASRVIQSRDNGSLGLQFAARAAFASATPPVIAGVAPAPEKGPRRFEPPAPSRPSSVAARAEAESTSRAVAFASLFSGLAPLPRPGTTARPSATTADRAPAVEVAPAPVRGGAPTPAGEHERRRTETARSAAADGTAIASPMVPPPTSAERHPFAPLPAPDPASAIAAQPSLSPAFAGMATMPHIPMPAGAAERLLDLAADDPTLHATTIGTSAHLTLHADGAGEVSLHLSVRDGVADLRVDGVAAQTLDIKQSEVRTALAGEGLSLGRFETTAPVVESRRQESLASDGSSSTQSGAQAGTSSGGGFGSQSPDARPQWNLDDRAMDMPRGQPRPAAADRPGTDNAASPSHDQQRGAQTSRARRRLHVTA
ncbi:MAG: hypothetical protein ABUS79_13620 [Pseudomonadota bacterium]